MDTWTQSMESSPDGKKYFSTIEWNKVNKQIEKKIFKRSKLKLFGSYVLFLFVQSMYENSKNENF